MLVAKRGFYSGRNAEELWIRNNAEAQINPKLPPSNCQLQVAACVRVTHTFGIRIAAKFEARHRNLVMHETVSPCLREAKIDIGAIDVIRIL
ncbi:hypothetical protein PUN28_018478 [Cardiocondyla obscurior]|uniref:Uncharacterized protein n=1 Tax=Cardiocondyla obscurior TaxID=286306 RepID=A0AAW2EE03_9HYME